jgi:hypothetical protein
VVGVNLDIFIVDQIIHGNFYVKFKLKNKNTNFQWILISVYGLAHEDRKHNFLKELVYTCNVETLGYPHSFTSQFHL